MTTNATRLMAVFFIALGSIMVSLTQTTPFNPHYTVLVYVGFLVAGLVYVPLIYSEIAIQARIKTSLLSDISSITRDNDLSPRWRILPWLANAIAGLFVGGCLFAAMHYVSKAGVAPSLSAATIKYGLPVLLLVFAWMLSRKAIAGIVTGSLALFALVFFNMQALAQPAASINSAQLPIYACMGFMQLSLILFVGLFKPNTTNAKESKHHLLAWISAILLIIATYVGYFAYQIAQTSQVIQQSNIAVGLLVLASTSLVLHLLLESAKQSTKTTAIWALLLLSIAAGYALAKVGLWEKSLVLASTVLSVAFSIFVGWKLKISHMRKALQFSSEWQYNIWRVFVRLVAPITLTISAIYFVMS